MAVAEGRELKTLRIPFAAGAVTRYHTTKMIHQQTVAEHSWGVAMIVLWVCENPSADLLKAALLHDVPEVAVGDTPATAKWDNPRLAEAISDAENKFCEEYGMQEAQLTQEERRVLKFADLMELVIFCVSEANMGNRYAAVIARRGLDYIAKHLWVGERANTLHKALEEQLNELSR